MIPYAYLWIRYAHILIVEMMLIIAISESLSVVTNVQGFVYRSYHKDNPSYQLILRSKESMSRHQIVLLFCVTPSPSKAIYHYDAHNNFFLYKNDSTTFNAWLMITSICRFP